MIRSGVRGQGSRVLTGIKYKHVTSDLQALQLRLQLFGVNLAVLLQLLLLRRLRLRIVQLSLQLTNTHKAFILTGLQTQEVTEEKKSVTTEACRGHMTEINKSIDQPNKHFNKQIALQVSLL